MKHGPRFSRATPETLLRAIEHDGTEDPRVLDAFRRVDRAGFVPPDGVAMAYEDGPIPIPHGQVTTQPSLVARMVAGLRLTGSERVLEVGTGFGFQTAILALLAREVLSIERFADLAEQARANLEASGITGVTIVVGDGTLGLPEHAPYDAILVSAAAPAVPPPLVEQLAIGGRLVQPIGPGGDEVVLAYRREPGGLVEAERLTGASFVPLIGARGLPEGRIDRLKSATEGESICTSGGAFRCRRWRSQWTRTGSNTAMARAGLQAQLVLPLLEAWLVAQSS